MKAVEEKIENSKKTGFLSLKGCNITSIPPAVFALQDLTTLIVSFNKISNIPNEISILIDFC